MIQRDTALKDPLDYRDRIKQVAANIVQTGDLLRQLEQDLAARSQVLEQLRADAEHYEALASLNAAQAKVVEDVIRAQFEQREKSTKRLWWLSLAAAFVLGLIVNWLSAPVWNLITHLVG